MTLSSPTIIVGVVGVGPVTGIVGGGSAIIGACCLSNIPGSRNTATTTTAIKTAAIDSTYFQEAHVGRPGTVTVVVVSKGKGGVNVGDGVEEGGAESSNVGDEVEDIGAESCNVGDGVEDIGVESCNVGDGVEAIDDIPGVAGRHGHGCVTMRE